MRSRMAADLAGHCPRCYLRSEHCACELISALPTKTRVVIVRHEREALKSTNSARWVALAVPQCEVWDYSGRGSVEVRLGQLAAPYLLFPEEPSANPAAATVGPSPSPSSNPVGTLVVLDGTWRQTRRILNHSPRLQAMPRYGLPRGPATSPALRGQHLPDGRSTLEAVALALGMLEGPGITTALLRMHAEVITRVHKGRGTFKPEGDLG